MAAVTPQPAMTTIQLQVPPDAQPGFMIQAQINGQTIQAQVPPGLQPGATFSVQVPAAPVDDPAANAAYDALLTGASRLTFPLHFEHGPYDRATESWGQPFLDVEADDRAAFRVKLDFGNVETARQSYGKYEAQIVLGGSVVQTVSSAGGPPLKGLRPSGQRLPDPVASQSMDRGEALTVQVKRTNREEVVHLTRGGGGGLSLVTPPPDKKRCYAAGCCLAGTFFPVTCALSIVLAFIPVETGRETYVAYDATGTPLGAKLVVPGQIGACCRNICRPGDPWLDLGATPVAARRDLVAAAVALRCTDSAAYGPPPTG